VKIEIRLTSLLGRGFLATTSPPLQDPAPRHAGGALEVIRKIQAEALRELAARIERRELGRDDLEIEVSLSAGARLLLLESEIQDGAEKHCDSPAPEQVKRLLARGPAGNPAAPACDAIVDALADQVAGADQDAARRTQRGLTRGDAEVRSFLHLGQAQRGDADR
jgi:hypothetical protein